MKKNIFYGVLLIVFSVALFSSCGNGNSNDDTQLTVKTLPSDVDKSGIVYNFLEKSGNIINNDENPISVSAEEVHDELASVLVIDIRNHEDYVDGHIDGARNANFNNLISYFKDSIITTSYNKVVLVCYSGQKTSYTAMLLRIIGYNNVYSLRWGMSSWDKNIANQYLYKNSSSSYISKLEKVNNKPVNTNKYPRILSDKVNAYDIILDKAQSLLDSGKFTISTEEVFANPSKYYIISYWPQIHYEKGHIAGAFQFEPFNSLTKDKQLSTLPIDKPILVYCYSGQQSATVAAYLRILGYDAYSLAFGANSFMLSTLKSGIGHVFGAEEIMNYPLVKGEKPSISSGNNINPSVTNGKTENNNITLPVKKKTKTQGGGC